MYLYYIEPFVLVIVCYPNIRGAKSIFARFQFSSALARTKKIGLVTRRVASVSNFRVQSYEKILNNTH